MLEAALPSALTAVAAMTVGYLTYAGNRTSKKTELVAAEQTAQLARIDRMQARIDMLEEQTRRMADYVQALRRHISDELGPPPPPFPHGLDV